MMDCLPEQLRRILAETPELSHAYLVGGCVRDWLLGLPVKDFDLEVFGVPYEALERALARWGRTDLVGRSFGVVKLTLPGGAVFDFTLPRRDSKVAPGHRGFAIAFDPDITPREAATRRDFTMNALMFDPRRGEVLDFFGGRPDAERRVLRHTGPAFVEDPLRVLRGMQFVARFALTAAPETVALCRTMQASHADLAIERVREEWFKWAGRSRVPSAGLRFLADTGWLAHYPELEALRDTPQDPEWHPEGDVFTHTSHCCDALAGLPGWQAADETTRIVLSLAVLTHDLGKPATTRREPRAGEVRIVSPGHEEAGVSAAESFLTRINTPRAIVERVLPLVCNHMAHWQDVTDRMVRRLARRLEPESIENLCLVITADAMGRPPRPPRVPAGVTELRTRAAALQVQARAPKPVLRGRHLLELGLTPGPAMGEIVDAAYEAQLEGAFADLPGACRWLQDRTDLQLPHEARAALAARLGLQGPAGADG